MLWVRVTMVCFVTGLMAAAKLNRARIGGLRDRIRGCSEAGLLQESRGTSGFGRLVLCPEFVGGRWDG